MIRIILFFFICIVSLQSGLAQEKEKQKIPFRDSLDGAIDASYFLATKAGFLPLVMPITEPAVGYGAGGGLIFIHRDLEALSKGEPSPPSLSMVGGLYTENGTWGAGGLHSGVWKNDRIRYLGAAFYASANLTYYPALIPREYNFNLEATGLVQQIAFRLGKPKVFAGVRYQFSYTKATFDRLIDLPEVIEPWEIENKLGGAGPVLFVDYRDNSFTPNKGVLAKATYMHFAPWLGGDVTYHTTQLFGLWFAQPLSWLVTGLRAEFQNGWGEIPFFAEPFVNLRGIPAMRFQNNYTLTFETEERFDVTPRWSLVAFGGLAKAFDGDTDINEFDWAYNYGAGVRYKIARLLGIYGGIDFAWGPDSWAFYIMFGHAWNRL